MADDRGGGKVDQERPLVTVLSRRRIAGNRVFDLYFDHVVPRDGEPVPEYLVVAPKHSHPGSVTGVSVLPEREGKLGLIRVYRHAIGRSVWEVPRGFVEPGESDAVSAMRELEEEAGLAAAPEDLLSVGAITPEAGVIAARVRLFLARRCRAVRDYAPSELGHEALEWFGPDAVHAMIDDGAIEDPSTQILVCRLALMTAR